MMTKITHFGLVCDEQTLPVYLDRVYRFNQKYAPETEDLVVLEAQWSETPIPQALQPHYRMLFTYKNKEVADKFWSE
jgi:hypothetical protein